MEQGDILGLYVEMEQAGKDGQPQYQDVCFSVTREFWEKLYDAILESYKKEREQTADRDMKKTVEQIQVSGNVRKSEMGMVFH